MIDRTTRLRWRRRVRRSRRQVEDMGTQAEEHLDRHFFKRLNRFINVRRFIATWIAFMLLLIGGVFMQIRGLGKHYLAAQPSPGGIYVEGIGVRIEDDVLVTAKGIKVLSNKLSRELW